jgi:hypothetical protein
MLKWKKAHSCIRRKSLDTSMTRVAGAASIRGYADAPIGTGGPAGFKIAVKKTVPV